MTDQQEQFYIQTLNISSNDRELKTLQRKMLMQHYNQATKQKGSQKLSNPQEYSYVNSQQYFKEIKQRQNLQKNYKKQLAQEYQRQILRKQRQKNAKKNNKRIQQEQDLKHNRQIQYQQIQRSQSINNLYKKQVQNDLVLKQQQKKQQKKLIQQQKQYFKKRYSVQNLGGTKKRSFQQYYDKLYQARDKIQKNYLQYTTPSIKQQEKRKNIITEKSINNNNQSKVVYAIQKQFELADRAKNQLKEALLKQIDQKRYLKNLETKRNRQEKYTTQNYKSIYHPINNPVDFKMSHDNHYILSQLKDKTHLRSNLAQSGSNSIFL